MNTPVISRQLIRRLATENTKRPEKFSPVPMAQWPLPINAARIQVLVSREYLVQIFEEPERVLRLSISRTQMRPDGQWEDGLTWEELQHIKQQCGLGDCYAIEVYPRDQDVVNVANMRHLWVLPAPLSIGWTKHA